jgi:hypothetical protein
MRSPLGASPAYHLLKSRDREQIDRPKRRKSIDEQCFVTETTLFASIENSTLVTN